MEWNRISADTYLQDRHYKACAIQALCRWNEYRSKGIPLLMRILVPTHALPLFPRTRPILRVFAFGVMLLAGASAHSADLIEDIEGAYAARQIEHVKLDPSDGSDLSSEDLRFFEELFALADEVVLINTNVLRWFLSGESKGLHAADYAERNTALALRFEALEVPARAESVRGYLIEMLELERRFVAEWYAANESGLVFSSQLTKESAYHEGLHRSGRLLLKSYAELRALFPGAGETTKRAIRLHLHAMVLR